MQPLTTKFVLEAISKFAPPAGVCATSEEARVFLRQVLDDLAYSGAHGNLKKWCLCACSGCFTLPRNCETPLKVTINDRLSHVWDKWFEFYGQASGFDCSNIIGGLHEDPNSYYTVYDGPASGYHVLVVPDQDEDPDAHVTIQGLNEAGQSVYTEYNGKEFHGEYISICATEPTYSRTKFFGPLAQVVKTTTKGQVKLYWYLPKEGSAGEKGLLTELAPKENQPLYHRWRLVEKCPYDYAKVTILGRIRTQEYYDDDDYLPFDNLNLYVSTAQKLMQQTRNDYQTSAAADQIQQRDIRRQNEYHKTGTSVLNISRINNPSASNGRRVRVI